MPRRCEELEKLSEKLNTDIEPGRNQPIPIDSLKEIAQTATEKQREKLENLHTGELKDLISDKADFVFDQGYSTNPRRFGATEIKNINNMLSQR